MKILSKMTNKKTILIGFLLVFVLAGGFIQTNAQSPGSSATGSNITSFEQCVKAGYPATASYPGQCRTPDGSVFIQDVVPPIAPSPKPSPSCSQISLKVEVDENEYKQGETLTGQISITNSGQSVPLDLSLKLYKKSQDNKGKDKWVLFWQKSAKLNIPKGTKTISLDKAFTFSPTIPFQDFVLGKWKLKFEGKYASQTGTKSLGAMLKSIITGKSTDSGTTKPTEPMECQWQDEDEFNIHKGKEHPPKTECGNNICEAGEEGKCPEDCEIEPPITKSTNFIGADAWPASESYKYLQPLADNQINFFGQEKVYWNNIEPTPTSGYDWSQYDLIIQDIESVEGDVLPTIWSVSTWATEYPSNKKPSSPPKLEYEQRYYDFIKAFMERYDNDGIDDMPGLKYAHNYLQIEDEAENLGDSWTVPSCSGSGSGFYICAATKYREMLKLAYQASKEANPNSKIVSFSFNPGDYFDNNPLDDMPSNPKLDFLNEVFANYSQYFDIIGIQCNYDYTGIPAWINYMKNEWGHLNKPIICADAGAMPMLIRHQFQPSDKYLNKYPYMTDEEILTVLGDPSNSKYNEIKLWWEAEKAKLSVKKAVAAAGADADNIFFQFIMSPWKITELNSWDFSGLLSAGPDYNQPEPIGTAKPVVYALGQLNEKVADFKTIKNLNPIPVGQDPYNWNWQYKINNKTYITWTEKTGGATIDLSSYISTSNVKITPIITELDNSYNPIYPTSETVPVNAIPIDETPIFVEIKN